MLNSENLNKFNESRNEFNPYGLTCELWTPSLMRKPDRHNEIEINYFPKGSMTYLFQGNKITIPTKKLAIFWGLVPHQIISYDGESPYYVCTIPFSQFLEWNLPELFVDRILSGEVVLEASEDFSLNDEFLLKNWMNDMNLKDSYELILREMNARLFRMAKNSLLKKENVQHQILKKEISHVEKIAIYIAQNFNNQIKISDIGEAVNLHPDYANSIFKKAFGSTLNEYIIEERISHAQRKLVTTELSITEIAYECGFNSIGRFNVAFRKFNNCTPREFRKRYQ